MCFLRVLLVTVPMLGGAAGAQTEPPDFPPAPHQVTLLGTFHFVDAGLDDFKPQVDIDIRSEARQRELEDVLGVLARFRPTRIAVEAMPQRQAELDQRYQEYRRGEFELPANEVYQIGFRLAKRLGHDRVHAIDAERRWYQPYVDPEKYAREHGQEAIVESPWYATYQAASQQEDGVKATRTLGETLLALNDPDRIRRSHGIYLVGTFKAGVGSEYPGADVKTAWYNRNLRIFANIQRTTRTEAERILVVIGAGHLPILRHCVETSPEYDLIEVAALADGPKDRVPPVDAEQLLRAHTYELAEAGAAANPGLDFILAEAADAQFVLLGEPHNTDQVNHLAATLLELLHERLGFGYLVTEQDGLLMDLLAGPGVRGNLAALRQQARRHRGALHFRTDSELELLAEVGRIADAAHPIWGIDRILDAELGLEALLASSSSSSSVADRERIRAVLDEARRFGQDRANADRRFISSQSAGLDSLLGDLQPEPGSKAAEILHALRVSRQDLRAYEVRHDPGEPWGFQANERREELMKTRFLDHYRRAVAAGETLPKALVKLGHWHVTRGHNPGSVPSVGNLLSEIARFNGRRALSINIQPVNPPGRHWSITDYPDYALFATVGDPTKSQLVDLRPLRGYLHAGSLSVSEDVRRVIFGYDLLLLLGGTDRGQVTWDEGR